MNKTSQRTLAGSFTLQGKGLHTGLRLTLTCHPAAENSGYQVLRSDLAGTPTLAALPENVVDTRRGTTIGSGTTLRVATIEHALSALSAAGIDNCLLAVDGPEFPILDGSAKPFVEKIQQVGIAEQHAAKKPFAVNHKIEYRDAASGSSLTILPDDEFSIITMCAFESKFINSQYAILDTLDDYNKEIAPSRTFVFVRDILPLLEQNLIKGGDLDNAIVIYERQVQQEKLNRLADLMNVPYMDATRIGYIQHRPLSWENECTRHKLLDVIGDLALVGRPIKGKVIAIRPGHSVNTAFARLLRDEMLKEETV